MKYSAQNATDDILRLVTETHFVFRKQGVLSRCLFCDADAVGLSTVEGANDGMAVISLCKKHHEANPSYSALCDAVDGDAERESSLIVPDSEEKRVKVIDLLRKMVLDHIHSKNGFPVVMQPLIADKVKFNTHAVDYGVLAFAEGGKLHVVLAAVPWRDDDPLIVGGQLAADCLALHKAIKRGDAEILNIGRGIVVSARADVFGGA
jgi:hypothetical protein